MKQHGWDKALVALKQAHAVFPELRLCQLIINASSRDPFYVTDEQLAQMLAGYVAAHRVEK